MPLKIHELTNDDVAATKWEDRLAEAKEQTCLDYCQVFSKARDEAEAKGAEKEAGVFNLLSCVTSMGCRPDDKSAPFRPQATGPGWRTATLEDFSDEQIDLVRDMLPTVRAAEMRARLGHMLWARRRDHRAARLAIEAYLESASALEDHVDWTECFERLQLALYLALPFGDEERDNVLNRIDKILTDSESVATPSYFAAKLLELLLAVRKGDAARLASVAETHAKRAEVAKNAAMAQVYWDLAARAWQRSGTATSGRTSAINAAEAHFKEAEATTGRSFAAAAEHVRRAIQAYRHIGGEKERIEELHRIMLDYQKRSVSEFKPYSVQRDISALVQQAKQAVQGKALGEALLEMCRLTRPPIVGDLKKEAQSQAGQFLFMSLFPSGILDEQGRTVARRGPIRSTDMREDDDALAAQMYANANMQRDLVARALIVPASEQIRNEHAWTAADFLSLVVGNPFVPQGREHIVASGLSAGLNGEFMNSLHLLMPQVENSIRETLRARAVITSTLDDEGIQEERDLNTLLYVPAIRDVFDEDQLFELRGLLVKRFGANLRNKMAHGFLSALECYSGQSAYFWWMVLRLVVINHLMVREQPAGDA